MRPSSRMRGRANAARMTMTRTIRAGATRMRPLFERRKTGSRRRLRRKLGCNLGSVVDISGGGMRLRSSRRLTGQVELELWISGRSQTVTGLVVWTRRVAFRKFDVGLRFVELPPAAASGIASLAP